jgi:hypothetical protein
VVAAPAAAAGAAGQLANCAEASAIAAVAADDDNGADGGGDDGGGDYCDRGLGAVETSWQEIAGAGATADGAAATAGGAATADSEWQLRLMVGSWIAAEARKAVAIEAGFRCSAGVAANKMLAKLVSGLHKPDDQTILLPPQAAVSSGEGESVSVGQGNSGWQDLDE